MVYPQTPPHFSTAPKASSGKFTGLFIAVVVIAVVIVGGGLLVMDAADAPDYADYDPVAEHPEFFTQPESAPPTAPANYRVSAEIGAHCEGVSYGSRWYLHEYRNTGDGPISFPKILVQARDAKGALIRNSETTSNVYALPAGESAWLHTTLPKEAASATFTVAAPERVREYTPAVSRLTLVELTHTPHATMKDYIDLKGQVKNAHSRSLSSVLVQAIGFDEQGQPCSYTLVYADSKVIAPGAASKFAVIAGTWQVTTPTRWEIHAWGIVEK